MNPDQMPVYDKDEDYEGFKAQAENGELKEAINLFVWEHANPRLTLSKADEVAGKIYDILIEGVRDE